MDANIIGNLAKLGSYGWSFAFSIVLAVLGMYLPKIRGRDCYEWSHVICVFKILN